MFGRLIPSPSQIFLHFGFLDLRQKVEKNCIAILEKSQVEKLSRKVIL